jgi:hypothetical protein
MNATSLRAVTSASIMFHGSCVSLAAYSASRDPLWSAVLAESQSSIANQRCILNEATEPAP